ncbi:hypothetical protein LGH82_10630 [Mesorhizobium sp. PAMC28654]|uniref:hypothetical protein n=1 Tax=Mesorhizobium sp. PAMC28654 TaxID=2880934 RepID=UPI001D0AC788|nr:hypothetical protein [Mesorhizobium sp. PAMC28654]UDL91645.1 hypothetical protein LGH82_10630 [Mesorhizobium sp. PAMC28654]
MNLDSKKIGIVAPSYVGLPLAIAFGATTDVVGFDINQRRIDALLHGDDYTLEASRDDISAASRLKFTAHKADLRECGIFIVTFPTPIDKANRPVGRLVDWYRAYFKDGAPA